LHGLLIETDKRGSVALISFERGPANLAIFHATVHRTVLRQKNVCCRRRGKLLVRSGHRSCQQSDIHLFSESYFAFCALAIGLGDGTLPKLLLIESSVSSPTHLGVMVSCKSFWRIEGFLAGRSFKLYGHMKTDFNDEDFDRSADSAAQLRQSGTRPSKLIECPFAVRIDAALHDQFYDVRDAMAAARIAKRRNPTAVITIADVRTGKLLIEVQA
jgi:hypothetical protein